MKAILEFNLPKVGKMDFPKEIYVWDESSDTIYRAVITKSNKKNKTFCNYSVPSDMPNVAKFAFTAQNYTFPVIAYAYPFQRTEQRSFSTFAECLDYREQILQE